MLGGDDKETEAKKPTSSGVTLPEVKITDEEDAAVKATYGERRRAAQNSPSGLGFTPNKRSALDDTPEQRRAVYEQAWTRLGFGFVLAYHDLILDADANATASDFVREKIAAQIDDPVTRERLLPRGFAFGTKRPSVDDRYYPTFNRANVTLVDLRVDGRRAGRAHAARALGGRPAHLPGAVLVRLPEPGDDRRAGQPVVAVERAGVDRAARRLAGRPARQRR